MLITGVFASCDSKGGSSEQSASAETSAETTEAVSEAETSEPAASEPVTDDPGTTAADPAAVTDSPYIGKWHLERMRDKESGTVYNEDILGVPVSSAIVFEVTDDMVIINEMDDVSEGYWYTDEHGKFVFERGDGTIFKGSASNGKFIIDSDLSTMIFVPYDGEVVRPAEEPVQRDSGPAVPSDPENYNGGDITGIWEMKFSETEDVSPGVREFIDFGTENMYTVYFVLPDILTVRNGKVIYDFDDDELYSFDGRIMTISDTSGDALVIMERVSDETDASSIDGTYRVTGGTKAYAVPFGEEAPLIIKDDIVYFKAYDGEYATNGNKLMLETFSYEDEYFYDVDGDKMKYYFDEGLVLEYVRVKE